MCYRTLVTLLYEKNEFGGDPTLVIDIYAAAELDYLTDIIKALPDESTTVKTPADFAEPCGNDPHPFGDGVTLHLKKCFVTLISYTE